MGTVETNFVLREISHLRSPREMVLLQVISFRSFHFNFVIKMVKEIALSSSENADIDILDKKL